MLRNLFDIIEKFELRIRRLLKKYPLAYTVLGAIFLILFWKGVEDTASMYPVLSGPLLIIVTVPILILLGLFLPFFIADRSALTKIEEEEKIVAREERIEERILEKISDKLNEVDQEVHEIQAKINESPCEEPKPDKNKKQESLL